MSGGQARDDVHADAARRPFAGTPAAVDAQLLSAGNSQAAIHEAVLSASSPEPSLAWLDIGCGTGDVLRAVHERFAPERLVGVDLIDWLDGDLREHVEVLVGPAEELVDTLEGFDRVLMVETIEHLPAPWTVLARAAACVKPGGRIVVSTPNVATLRHRLELLARGHLTSFRPGNAPHMTPALPHVIASVLAAAGLSAEAVRYAGSDVIPLTGGTTWPEPLRRRWARAGSVSVIIVGRRP